MEASEASPRGEAPPTRKTVAALERLSTVFRMLLWEAGSPHGLSPLQLQILRFLAEHPEEKLRALTPIAQEFGLTKPTASDALSTLRTKGYVEAVPSASDGRRRELRLTDDGRALLHKVQPLAAPLEQALDQSLSPPERETLLEHLLRVIAQLNASGVVLPARMCFRCQHYAPGRAGHAHYCALLDQALQTDELRIDCPEFAAAGNRPSR